MTLLIDKRDLTYDRLDQVDGADAFLGDTDRVAAEVDHTLIAEPGKVNHFTGHLTELKVDGAPSLSGEQLAGTVPEADYIARAKEYVTSVAQAIGFAADEPAEFEADPRVTTTSEGMRVVSLQQTLNGIEVSGMAPKVWLQDDGTVDRVVGDTASVPANLSASPAVPVEVALAVAAAKAAEPTTLQSPFGDDELPALDIAGGFERLASQARNDQPTTFSQGAFDEAIPARLVYLYMGGEVRLAWSFTLSRASLAVQYHALVEADDRTADKDAPEILYFQDLANHIIQGRVFQRNPAESGFGKVTFPLPTSAYPTQVPTTGIPSGFPLSWTGTHNGHVATDGNNVVAVDGNSGKTFDVLVNAAGNAVFDPKQDTPEQFVTNIFYFCNYMHDFFMMLGFTEEHGNFQTTNVTGKGKGADPVEAFAHPNPVEGTANMSTRADGLAAVMNMGLVSSSGRHTANDADVVFHEFTHGVTKRLVGGLLDAQGLSEPQSRAMGEGWSDFFALTTRNFSQAQERVVTGNWVINDPRGIRQRPYDSGYPGRFGDVGKGPGQLAGGLNYTRIHNVGEIWCATLMEMIRNVVMALGNKDRGYRVTWQAVVDGLKLTPKNPSFLVARDAILRALKAMKGGPLTDAEYTAARKAAWESFAKFGMGFDASCPNAFFVGCKGGTAMPPAGHED
ncbi:M36 family metallopeptidase [Streptomyces sp. NPDC050636]|uniref:M36 family metallopeptidase n=1 Tax=Streptomyces sp. NPDC050636 TaxID=3154510 RepID=UPI00341FE912